MGIIKSLRDRLSVRQERYFQLEDLNLDEVIKFKSFDASIKDILSNTLDDITLAKSIEDAENNLLIGNCKKFRNRLEMFDWLDKVIKEDVKDSLQRSKNGNWDFYYFIGETGLVKDAVLIIANLYQPPDETSGNVLYNLAYIKFDGSEYFVWDSN